MVLDRKVTFPLEVGAIMAAVKEIYDWLGNGGYSCVLTAGK